MRIAKRIFLPGIMATIMTAQANAATVINFTDHASNADFLVPAAPGITDRSIDWNGSFSYASGLPDGTYGPGVLISFSSIMHRSITVTGLPASLTADYDFSLADLSALSLTLTGGLPTDIVFAFNSKLPYAFSTGLGTVYASISGDTNNDDVVDFSFGASPTAMTLVAHDGGGGISIVPQGIPEPTSWALMVVGIGAIGAAIRRRRTALRYAYG